MKGRTIIGSILGIFLLFSQVGNVEGRKIRRPILEPATRDINIRRPVKKPATKHELKTLRPGTSTTTIEPTEETKGPLVTVTFNGPAASYFNAGQQNFVVLKLTFETTEDIEISGFTLFFIGTDAGLPYVRGEGLQDSNLVAYYNSLRMIDNNTGEIYLGPVELISGNIFNTNEDYSQIIHFPDQQWFLLQAGVTNVSFVVNVENNAVLVNDPNDPTYLYAGLENPIINASFRDPETGDPLLPEEVLVDPKPIKGEVHESSLETGLINP